MPAFSMNDENREDFYFDMKGKRILKLSAQNLPGFVEQCLKEAGVKRESIDLVVPHQASRALDVIMPRLGFRKGTYIDRVSQYGNMISASVPTLSVKPLRRDGWGRETWCCSSVRRPV